MMRTIVLLVTFGGFLVACGVDGEPKTPPRKEASNSPSPGVSISGSASVGVVGGSG